MKANPYPTDLTDEQWIILLPLVPPRAPVRTASQDGHP